MKLLVLGVLVLVSCAALAFRYGPREPVDLRPRLDLAALPADLDGWLAAREARIGGITPGTEKRILWAEATGVQADWAVVYVHGFSGTSEELRPVPDLVAGGLSANLYFTRLAGHGLAGARLAGPTAQDWVDDTAEALAIGRRIGRRVLVVATSTGGTLVAEALRDPVQAEAVAGVVFVSPNFGIRSRAAKILTWPWVRRWGPVVAGRERCFEAINPDHRRFWTTCYPTEALFPMAALVKHAAAADYASVTVPALFLFAAADQVVDPSATQAVAGRWGAITTLIPQVMGPGDDPYGHVIAGRVLSPSRTEPVAREILDWARGL